MKSSFTTSTSATAWVGQDRVQISNLPDGYEYDRYGFLKQSVVQEFEYTQGYKEKQRTNLQMSFLRLGWLCSYFSYEQIKSMVAVDVGCGSGEFVKHTKNVFGDIKGYDVVGESITKDELNSTIWDLVILSDVLEHFSNIDDLFEIKWRFCMLSFPETPEFTTFDQLQTWRHFKPNEHIYHLYSTGVVNWVEDCHGALVLGVANFEDLIRTRWDDQKTNISTMFIARDLSDEEDFDNNPVSQ